MIIKWKEKKKIEKNIQISQVQSPEGNKYFGSKTDGNKYQANRSEGNRSDGSKYRGNTSEGSKPEWSKYRGNKPEGNRPEESKYRGNRSEGSKPEGSKYRGIETEGSRSEGSKFYGAKSQGNVGRGYKDKARFQGERSEKVNTEDINAEIKVERKGFEAEFEADSDRLEGRNSILEALKAGRTINKIIVVKGEREGSIRQIIAMAREKGIIVQEFERSRIDDLAVTRAHQGVIAYVSVKDYVEVDDILKIAEASGKPPFILVLDEITDPQNLGSILRTADAVGAHGVIIPKRRAASLNASVSKASAGAVEYVPVARVTNIGQTIDLLKKNNIWVVGTDSSGKQPFYESDLKGPIALVIGSEGEGIGRLVLEKCDFVVNIPMLGKISSLNASAAGAVVMYEILKQRSK